MRKLSFASRLTLIKSILNSCFVYWGSIFSLPKMLIKQIESILNAFLWSSVELKHSKTKISLLESCKSLIEGGLGLKNLKLWNKALILRHLWDIFHKKYSLGIQWVHTYLLKGSSLWSAMALNAHSWNWKKMLKLRSIARHCIKMVIGDGQSTFLWQDCWHPLGPLLQVFSH